MDVELIEFGSEDDHVHLIVCCPPKLAASKLIGKLKGKSSYFLRQEYWPQLKTSYGEDTCGLQAIVWFRVEGESHLTRKASRNRNNLQVKKEESEKVCSPERSSGSHMPA